VAKNLFNKKFPSIVVSVTDTPSKATGPGALSVVLPISKEIVEDTEGLISYFNERMTPFFADALRRRNEVRAAEDG
jgi:hypothetical protein